MSEATQTPTDDPEQLGRLFAERANAGDLEGLLALYEDTATFVGPDGVGASGRHDIHVRLEGLLATKPTITRTGSQVLIAGDIALMSNRWHLAIDAGNEAPVDVDGRSTEVARRQPEGGWLYVIDNPTVVSGSEAPR
jgi:ketosteroid isomerase-like protein